MLAMPPLLPPASVFAGQEAVMTSPASEIARRNRCQTSGSPCPKTMVTTPSAWTTRRISAKRAGDERVVVRPVAMFFGSGAVAPDNDFFSLVLQAARISRDRELGVSVAQGAFDPGVEEVG